MDALPAGKPSQQLNASFSAYDYNPGKLNGARSFLMDDYHAGRTTKSYSGASLLPSQHVNKPPSESTWAMLHCQKSEPQFQATQGFAETKFHAGFMRRQQESILQDAARKRSEQYQQERAARAMEQRRERLGQLRSFAYNGYNIITGEDFDPSRNRALPKERRHVLDNAAARETTTGADTAGGRLRDSTSRFFCTPDLMPHREARQQLLESNGLVATQRTSTVIGVGPNPSQEILSVGAREALSDSLYGKQRRREVTEAQAKRAADVSMVAALK